MTDLEDDLQKRIVQMKQEVYLSDEHRSKRVMLGWEIVLESPQAYHWKLTARSHMGGATPEDMIHLGLITTLFRTPIKAKQDFVGSPDGPHEWEWSEA